MLKAGPHSTLIDNRRAQPMPVNPEIRYWHDLVLAAEAELDAATSSSPRSGSCAPDATSAPASRRTWPRTPSHAGAAHASWLNQIETWFSILARSTLNGASFTSVAPLRAAIDAFIAADNATATPFRWRKTSVPPKGLAAARADPDRDHRAAGRAGAHDRAGGRLCPLRSPAAVPDR
jgi:hypothetical protein